jgi:hypothetical protein
MQRSYQKGYFPSMFLWDVINKAKKFKSDTSKFVKYMKNLTCKGYDLATIYFSILRAIPHYDLCIKG